MSNRIKELRLSRKMTLKKFANDFNKFTENSRDKIRSVSYATISRWENEENKPKLEMWRKLAIFFNVSLGFIQGENTFQDIKDFSHNLMLECIFNKQLYSSKEEDVFYKLHSCLEKFAKVNKINYEKTFIDNGMVRGDAISIAEAMFKDVFPNVFFDRISMSKIPMSPSYKLADALVQQFMNYFDSGTNLINSDLIYIQGMSEHVKVMGNFIRQTENLQKLVKLRKDDKKNLDEKLNLVKSSFDDYSNNLNKIRNSMVHGTYNDKE